VQDRVINLTAQVVSAHVVANDVSADRLPGLIRNVYQALTTAEQASAEPATAEPAVAVKNPCLRIASFALIAARASKCSSGISRPTTK
jgi:predicted transcriptional regulator